MRIRPILFALLALAAACLPLGAQEGGRLLSDGERETLFATFRERLGAVTTLRADFVQERALPLSEERLVSKGICLYKAPEALRWEYTAPYRTLLIYNGGKAAKFDVVDGKLRRMPNRQDALALVMGEILYWMRGDFSRSRELYRMEVRETAREYRVTLFPKAKAMTDFLASILLTFDRESLFVTAVTLTGAEGDDVLIRFSGQENNRPAADALFSLTAPALP